MKIRTPLVLGVTGALVGLSTVAFADAPAPTSASAAHTPSFNALPTGKMTAPPADKAPARIPKTEVVDGFAVADPPKNQLRDGKITNVVIFGKDTDAKDYTAGKGGFSTARLGSDSLCFATKNQRGFDGDGPGEWAFDMEPTSRISGQWKSPPPLPKGQKPTAKSMSPIMGEMEVTAVHQERFTTEGNKARVEITDAWVDPVTHGVRLIGKSTLMLDRVGVSQGGVTLYAARGDKALHVVARREKPVTEAPDHPPTTPRDFRLLSASRMPLMVEKSDGQMDATQCGFAHVSLKATKGASEMASFETQMVFIDQPPPVVKKDDDDPTGANSGRPPPDPEPELRVRPIRATVSSTWGSRDKEPVISVSYGWSGRERQM